MLRYCIKRGLALVVLCVCCACVFVCLGTYFRFFCESFVGEKYSLDNYCKRWGGGAVEGGGGSRVDRDRDGAGGKNRVVSRPISLRRLHPTCPVALGPLRERSTTFVRGLLVLSCCRPLLLRRYERLPVLTYAWSEPQAPRFAVNQASRRTNAFNFSPLLACVLACWPSLWGLIGYIGRIYPVHPSPLWLSLIHI